YFDSSYSVYKDQGDNKCHILDDIKDDYGAFSAFFELDSPFATSSMCNKNEVHNSFGRTPDFDSQDIPAPSSDTKAWSVEESSINGGRAIYPNWWDRLNFLGPQGSMPMTSDISSQCYSG
ncbi:unnamed protein product, partial [Musa banksii]